MGFFAWLKSLFWPTPVSRDISAIPADEPVAEAAPVREVINTSGDELKPNHRRRALRDSRLLPKPKPNPGTSLFSRKTRKKYLTRDDASRLFSATMRTRNRNLRDLATDEDQLARYGLPIWRSESEVADAIGLTINELRHFSIHRHRETASHYVTFAIPKRHGGERLIHAPKRKLKQILRRLNPLLVSRLPVSPHAHAFLPGRSVGSNASPHVGKKVLLKLDLKDCFPTIHFGRVRGLFIALGYSYPVATVLAVLMTESPRQRVEADGKIYHVPTGSRVCVQGAPTSPGLCNAILLRLDHRLAGLSKKHGFDYTRYADDLTLSGNDPEKSKFFVALISRIAKEEGFRINREKTRVLRQGRRQHVTGVIVNQQPGLSRQDRRRIRAEIHQLEQAAAKDPSHVRRLAGKIAYLHMLNPAQAAPLKTALQKATAAR